MRSGIGRVNLGEGSKHIAEIGIGNANASVFHKDTKLIVKMVGTDSDAATFGEFDGVSDQIDQNLPDPMLVTLKEFRDIGVDDRAKRDVVFERGRGKEVDDAIEQGADFKFRGPEILSR